MNMKQILRELFKDHNQQQVSTALGKPVNYVSVVISPSRRNVSADLSARILNVMGYDLIVRSRTDGTEYVVRDDEDNATSVTIEMDADAYRRLSEKAKSEGKTLQEYILEMV